MSDYSELKRLAEAATPGKWSSCGSYLAPTREENGTTYVESWRSIAMVPADNDRQFIATANPATVLALIAENERLKSNVESLREGCHSLNGVLTNTETLRVETLAELRKSQAKNKKLKADLAEMNEKYEAARDRKNSITALQVENERLQEDLEMERDALLIFKSAVSALGEASKKLAFCARTSGGTAGPDQALIDACAAVEGVITIGGVARAMTYVEELKAEVESLRKALIAIRDNSSSLWACETAADALVDSRK